MVATGVAGRVLWPKGQGPRPLPIRKVGTDGKGTTIAQTKELRTVAMAHGCLQIAVIVGAAFAALLAFAAFSYTPSAVHSWPNYRWARAGKTNLRLGDNVSSASCENGTESYNRDTHLYTNLGADTDNYLRPAKER